MSLGGSNKLVSVAELAEYLGLEPRTVKDNWQRWGIKALKVGRQVRFAERDVAAWLQTRETSGK